MDLEVVGRHALYFDDDAMAAFVNSGDALVEWHSLQIDRYDVRHLLSAPPPSRRRNRNSEAMLSDEPSLQSQLNHERYLDLPLHSDQPEAEEDEKSSDTGGYRAVAFSYGNIEDPADSRNAAAGMESPGFHPPFPIPDNLLQSLPPTEKVHQIISRTAIFVSKHGGQSEIILRVKQGDNPSFGFLMPDHHLHAYFRFLVEHPELLTSEFDGRTQDDVKKDGSEHHNLNGVGGSLSLLGSVYGSGEEEDGDDPAKAEEDVSPDNSTVGRHTISHGLKKTESKTASEKDESESKNPILSNKEKVSAVKKNSAMIASKSGSVKGIKKEEKSGLLSAAAGKTRSLATGEASKFEPLILEPPPELKTLIDKLVEFIMRNGKQFEATLIEQDCEHRRFPFLLPSNQYHSYYLKVLQRAQEGKVNGKSSHSGKDDLFGRGMDKKTSLLKENDFSSLASACDIPFESDRKEKFKMVISKSKKETQETESKGIQPACGTTVDAAAAAAILQAAMRGIKNPNRGMVSSTSQSVLGHVNSRDGQPESLGSLLSSRPDKAVEKSNRNGSRDVSVAVLGTACEADSSEPPLTEEQKLKAERLRRAKMFVAMLKSGAVNSKTGASRGSSVEPLGSGVEVNLNITEREGSLCLADADRPATGEKPDRNYFGEEHDERHSKRTYRSRAGGCEDDYEDDDEDKKETDKRQRRSKYRSKSRKYEEDDENKDAVETEQKHKRRRRQSHSSSEDNDDQGKGHKDWASEYEDKHKEDTYKRSRKKHHSHHHERSRKRYSSKQHSHEEDEHDNEGKDHKPSSKKHRSRRSSNHSKDKHRHGDRHSSREKESKRHLKHHSSSDDEHRNENDLHVQRDELEEGEISSRVSEESRGIASGHVSRETSVDATSFYHRATSQPSETTEVPDDLRAKIRAMLMATRL